MIDALARTSEPDVTAGDFFVSSWGYDQTNVDFYQVVRISDTGKTVWLRHVQSRIVDGDGTAYTKVIPVPDTFGAHDADPYDNRAGLLKRKLRTYDHGNGVEHAVTITSYADAYLWTGKPAYETGAQFGR